MYGEDPRALAQEFAEWRELRPGLTRAVFHSSLSLPHGPSGREELSDAQWRDVAERYLEHLGYGRSPFVVVRHRDTEHDHVHIIAARIGADGRAVSDSHDYRRGEEVLRQLEREYGLTQVKSAHEVDKTAMRPGEIRQLERTGEVSARLRLQDLLDRAAADRPSMSVIPQPAARSGRRSGSPGGHHGTRFRASRTASMERAFAAQRSAAPTRGVVFRSASGSTTSLSETSGRCAQRRSDRTAASTVHASPWSPASLDALQKELRALPNVSRRGVVSRAASGLARAGAGAFEGPADAVRLTYALRSPRSALRLAARRTPGLGAVAPILDLANATRSPLGLLIYGARLATTAGRLALPALAKRAAPSPLSRGVAAAYIRAAATGAPAMGVFLDRLESAGVRPLPLLGRGGEVRAIVYRLGGELIPGTSSSARPSPGPAFNGASE